MQLYPISIKRALSYITYLYIEALGLNEFKRFVLLVFSMTLFIILKDSVISKIKLDEDSNSI